MTNVVNESSHVESSETNEMSSGFTCKNLIGELTKILVPPSAPSDFDLEILGRNEKILGVKFPTDFVEYAKIYGSGIISCSHSWDVWSPCRNTYPLFVLEFARICYTIKDAMEVEDVPFGIYPEIGGLLPFASTPGGDWVCWITAGRPDEWQVVDMCSYSLDDIDILKLSFSEYFFRVLMHEVRLPRLRKAAKWSIDDIKFDCDFLSDRDYLESFRGS